jgi:DNA polymerase-3 subunit gamma/tau
VAGNLALYRKYRSATFAEVIGQDHVTVPLRQALAAGRINHAYLFSGPRGCGKTSSARILARSLNCIKGPTPDPCGECDSCRELAPNGSGSIDVIEIDAASHGGVDDARDLRERAFFAPVRDRFKVYIIDEAHMVTTQGFNALLKLVEEPPEFLVFIFATTEPDKVLTTIRSRTHHYPFRLIPPAVMRANLEMICQAEGVQVEPAVLPLVVRAGGGSARDSQSILDQLLAGAGANGVTYADAVALLGVTDGALLDDMIDALAAGDAAAVYGTVDRVVEAGHDPRRFSVDLLDRFRDLILLDAVPDAAERGLIDAPADQLAHMADQAARLGGGTLTRFAEIVHNALIEMRGTTAPRLVLELLCARMLLPDSSTDAAAVLHRLERLERRLSAAGGGAAEGSAPAAPASAAASASAPAPAPAAASTRPPAPPARPAAAAKAHAAQPTATVQPQVEQRPAATVPAADARPAPAGTASTTSSTTSSTTTPAPEPSTPAPAEPAPAEPALAEPAPGPAAAPGRMDGTDMRRLWPQVMDAIGRSSKTIWAMLEGSQVVDSGDGAVTVAVAPSLARRLAEERNVTAIAAAITGLIGGTWRVTVQPRDGKTGPSAPAAPAQPQSPVAAAAPPPEPDPRDDEDYDTGPSAAPAPRIDPETEAIRLITTEFDARPIE